MPEAPSFSVDHLDQIRFERFCFDLLQEMGFVNLRWREATASDAVSGGRQREIVCERIYRHEDPHELYPEKWFVECRHSKGGLGPTAFTTVLAWAEAQKPDVVLTVTSGFLSEPAKEYLANYARHRTPAFRITGWDKTDLEKLTVSRTRLRRKYDIGTEYPFLKILHPAHVMFIKKAPVSSLDYLFELLDSVDPEVRDGGLKGAYRLLPPDSQAAATSYEAFKNKCYELDMNEFFLTHAVVSYCLGYGFSISDTTSIDETTELARSARDFFRAKQAATGGAKDFTKQIDSATRRLETAPERIRSNYRLYEAFCDQVVAKLFDQEPRETSMAAYPNIQPPKSSK
jgi:hypothetical protein